jgi:hypothetical protein
VTKEISIQEIKEALLQNNQVLVSEGVALLTARGKDLIQVIKDIAERIKKEEEI